MNVLRRAALALIVPAVAVGLAYAGSARGDVFCPTSEGTEPGGACALIEGGHTAKRVPALEFKVESFTGTLAATGNYVGRQEFPDYGLWVETYTFERSGRFRSPPFRRTVQLAAGTTDPRYATRGVDRTRRPGLPRLAVPGTATTSERWRNLQDSRTGQPRTGSCAANRAVSRFAGARWGPEFWLLRGGRVRVELWFGIGLPLCVKRHVCWGGETCTPPAWDLEFYVVRTMRLSDFGRRRVMTIRWHGQRRLQETEAVEYGTFNRTRTVRWSATLVLRRPARG